MISLISEYNRLSYYKSHSTTHLKNCTAFENFFFVRVLKSFLKRIYCSSEEFQMYCDLEIWCSSIAANIID